MNKKKEGISARELLKRVYDTINESSVSKMVFPKKVVAEIGDDSDPHRTRIGYVGYDDAGILELGNKCFAIARGEKCGDYPGDEYDSDILALELESIDGNKEKLERRINESTYFRNSIICAMTDGTLSIYRGNKFADKMFELLSPRINDFIFQKPVYDDNLFLASTGRAVCKSPVLYKPEFADFLKDSITGILGSLN